MGLGSGSSPREQGIASPPCAGERCCVRHVPAPHPAPTPTQTLPCHTSIKQRRCEQQHRYELRLLPAGGDRATKPPSWDLPSVHHVKSRVKTSCVSLSIPRRPRPRAYFTLQEDKQKKKKSICILKTHALKITLFCRSATLNLEQLKNQFALRNIQFVCRCFPPQVTPDNSDWQSTQAPKGATNLATKQPL